MTYIRESDEHVGVGRRLLDKLKALFLKLKDAITNFVRKLTSGYHINKIQIKKMKEKFGSDTKKYTFNVYGCVAQLDGKDLTVAELIKDAAAQHNDSTTADKLDELADKYSKVKVKSGKLVEILTQKEIKHDPMTPKAFLDKVEEPNEEMNKVLKTENDELKSINKAILELNHGDMSKEDYERKMKLYKLQRAMHNLIIKIAVGTLRAITASLSAAKKQVKDGDSVKEAFSYADAQALLTEMDVLEIQENAFVTYLEENCILPRHPANADDVTDLFGVHESASQQLGREMAEDIFGESTSYANSANAMFEAMLVGGGRNSEYLIESGIGAKIKAGFKKFIEWIKKTAKAVKEKIKKLIDFIFRRNKKEDKNKKSNDDSSSSKSSKETSDNKGDKSKEAPSKMTLPASPNNPDKIPISTTTVTKKGSGNLDSTFRKYEPPKQDRPAPEPVKERKPKEPVTVNYRVPIYGYKTGNGGTYSDYELHTFARGLLDYNPDEDINGVRLDRMEASINQYSIAVVDHESKSVTFTEFGSENFSVPKQLLAELDKQLNEVGRNCEYMKGKIEDFEKEDKQSPQNPNAEEYIEYEKKRKRKAKALYLAQKLYSLENQCVTTYRAKAVSRECVFIADAKIRYMNHGEPYDGKEISIEESYTPYDEEFRILSESLLYNSDPIQLTMTEMALANF